MVLLMEYYLNVGIKVFRCRFLRRHLRDNRQAQGQWQLPETVNLQAHSFSECVV